MSNMKELVGRTIESVYVGSDQESIVFTTKTGNVWYKTYGDCCSETWIADVTGVEALLGATVANVESIEMLGYNTEDGRGRQEVDQAYGEKIVTDKGVATIVYRNSSNGYYGGNLEYAGDSVSATDMKEITEDWSA